MYPIRLQIKVPLMRAVVVSVVLLGINLAQVQLASAEPVVSVGGMLDAVNQRRFQAGLAPLTQESGLESLARERSSDMAGRQYFSHTTPDGFTVFNLMDQRGLSYRTAAENVAYNSGDEHRSVGMALDSFMGSAPHRGNLLNPDFNLIGVGIATAGKVTYFTLLFMGE